MQTQPIIRVLKSIPWTRVGSALVAIFSVSIAHYAGFIRELPPQIAITGGVALAAGVTATLFLFFTIAAAMSRILAIYIGSLVIATAAFFLPIKVRVSQNTFSGRIRFIRRFRRVLRVEAYLVWAAQASLFFLLIFGFYLREPREVPTAPLLTAVAITVMGILARMDVFTLSLKQYTQRIRNPQRHAFRARAGSQGLLGLTGLAVLLAFLAGEARVRHVLSLPPVDISSQHYTGTAKVLVNIGDLYLLKEEMSPNEDRYVVLSGKSVVAIDSNTEYKKLLP